MHNLKVCVNNDNLEGSFGLSLESMNCFLVTNIDKVIMYDSDTFQERGRIPIKLLVAEGREPNEVIGMTASKDENWLAIISGKNLVMNMQGQNQLFIFKRIKGNAFEQDKFEQQYRVVVKEIPFFQNVCMKFFFKDEGKDKNGRYRDPNSIIFAKRECIFTLNFITQEINEIYPFEPALLS